jgi:hypothetical protein
MRHGNLINGVLFQAAWFACVLGAAHGTSLWGAVVLAGLFAYSAAAATPRRDLIAAASAAAVGFVVDTAWIRTGILSYGGAGLAPVWIVMLWVAVGLSVNHSLAMFKLRPWLGGLLAGAGAPLSYLAGERFGAVVVTAPQQLWMVSVAWFVLFALTFTLSRAFEPGADLHRSGYERAH